jgi:hypothetical protein
VLAALDAQIAGSGRVERPSSAVVCAAPCERFSGLDIKNGRIADSGVVQPLIVDRSCGKLLR